MHCRGRIHSRGRIHGIAASHSRHRIHGIAGKWQGGDAGGALARAHREVEAAARIKEVGGQRLGWFRGGGPEVGAQRRGPEVGSRARRARVDVAAQVMLGDSLFEAVLGRVVATLHVGRREGALLGEVRVQHHVSAARGIKGLSKECEGR